MYSSCEEVGILSYFLNYVKQNCLKQNDDMGNYVSIHFLLNVLTMVILYA
jgi:hypothetical protein